MSNYANNTYKPLTEQDFMTYSNEVQSEFDFQ